MRSPSGNGQAGQPRLSLPTVPYFHPRNQSRESGHSGRGRIQRKPRVAVMATSKTLRDMADQMDREAEQQSAVSGGRFSAVLVERLSGHGSGQSGKRPGYLVQACQRAWQISAVFPSKWQQKRQQRSRKWRRRVERRRRRRTRHAEEKQASRKHRMLGRLKRRRNPYQDWWGSPSAGFRGRKLL